METSNQQKMHNYAAKPQDPAFNDGNIFALKNDLLLWHDITKTFQYFNLQNDLIKKINKVSFWLPIFTMVVVIMARSVMISISFQTDLT